MNSSAIFYQPSERYNITGFALSLLLLFPVWFMSLIYAGLLHWNPIKTLNILPFAGYLFSIMGVISLALDISDTRNKYVSQLLILIFGVLAIYFAWGNYLMISADLGPSIILNPSLMWGALVDLYQNGAYTFFGISNEGIFGVILWIFEAAIFLFILYSILSVYIKDNVYCESCERWVEPIKDFYEFSFPDTKDLVKRFKDKDLIFLDQAEPIKSDDQATFSIDATRCNTCNNSHYLTLRQKKADGEAVDVPLVFNRKVDESIFASIYKKSKHWIKYTETGKFSHLLWLWLCFVAFGVFVLGGLYQAFSIAIANYFVTFLLWGGFCFSLYSMTNEILKITAIRRSSISIFFGMLVGTIAVFLTAVTLFFQEIPAGDFLKPDVLWKAITLYINSHEFEGLAWFWLIIEYLGIFLAPMVGALIVSTTCVYCEKCKKWAEEESGILTFKHPDTEELKQKFSKQQLDFLQKIENIDENDSQYFKIDAEWCDQCNTTHTLSLVGVTKTKTAEGSKYSLDTLFEDMVVTKDTFDAIMQLSKAQKASKNEELSDPELTS